MATTRTELSDFSVQNEGTIFLLIPHTPAAQTWIDQHISADATRWAGTSVVVEHRYIIDIIDGIKADGLEVR